MNVVGKLQTNYIWFIGIFLTFLMGCTSDFSVSDFQEVSNSMSLRNTREEGKEPGGVPGLYVKKETGHKWTLIYDGKKQVADLKVSIVSWDEERYSLTDVFFNCEYVFSDSSKSGDTVSVKLDSFTDPNGTKHSGGIKGAIEHCYSEAGYAGSVPSHEDYPAVQFELIGVWEKPGSVRGVIAEHESYDYFINNDGAGKQNLILNLDRRSPASVGQRHIKGESEFFSVNDKALYAASNFDFWGSIIDPPKARLSFVDHYVWNDSGKVTFFSPKEETSERAAGILLEPTTLKITNPAGFIVEKFIVDPKNWKPGGG